MLSYKRYGRRKGVGGVCPKMCRKIGKTGTKHSRKKTKIARVNTKIIIMISEKWKACYVLPFLSSSEEMK